MAEEKAKKLMAEFPPVTTQEWEEAIAKAYEAGKHISFTDMHFRTDIGRDLGA